MLLRATSDVAQPRPRADGAARHGATAGARCAPTSGSTASAAATSTSAPTRRLHFTNVGSYFGGSYWKVHQLARFELRRVGRRHASAPWSASAPSSTTACATSSGPGPVRRSPRHRHYPGCNQNPYQDRVTLGTSVGWSDIYPADYDKQWINVAGLRGCFAFVMTVDPQHLLFESNERDNTSPPPGPPPLPTATPARLLSVPAEADRGEGAGQVAGREGALAQDLPVAVVLDRGDVDDGRGQPGQLAAVDRQVGAGDDRLGRRRRSAPARARR